jgi:nucleoside-diphosphate-sugar epimerase
MILVTGVTGFIAGIITDQLLRHGFRRYTDDPRNSWLVERLLLTIANADVRGTVRDLESDKASWVSQVMSEVSQNTADTFVPNRCPVTLRSNMAKTVLKWCK